MNSESIRFRGRFTQAGISYLQAEQYTEISRQTWSRLVRGKRWPRRYHWVVLEYLERVAKSEDGTPTREPWQRLSFPAPQCKCGAAMQRVRRKVVNRRIFYAWRCAKARKGKCDAARIWTDDQGKRVGRPTRRVSRRKRLGVERPSCTQCRRKMDFIGKKEGHPLLGSLWKWRCTGTLANEHKTGEILIDYGGHKVQLPRVRSWGWQLLPFERARLKNIPARWEPDRRIKEVLECCKDCGKPLKADQRGPSRWRLSCFKKCLEPYFVDHRGKRIEPRRQAVPRREIPRKARKCPRCRKFLTLSGDKWRERRSKPHAENLIRLACVEKGKRRHSDATFYFDIARNRFLPTGHMRPGQPRRECPVRRRCCGRPMWASHRPATEAEPEHWWQTCANPDCTRGRGGKRRYLKVGLDGKCLRWLRPLRRRRTPKQ